MPLKTTKNNKNHIQHKTNIIKASYKISNKTNTIIIRSYILIVKTKSKLYNKLIMLIQSSINSAPRHNPI